MVRFVEQQLCQCCSLLTKPRVRVKSQVPIASIRVRVIKVESKVELQDGLQCSTYAQSKGVYLL